MNSTLQLLIVALCIGIAVLVLLRRAWFWWQAGQRSEAKLSGCSGCSACPSATVPPSSHVTSPPAEGNLVPLEQLKFVTTRHDTNTCTSTSTTPKP